MDRFDWLELDSTPGLARSAGTPPPNRATDTPRTMPKDGPSFYRAAREMRAAGHFKAATDFYRRAIDFDDHNYAARAELIDTLVRAGRLPEAEQASRESSDNYRQVRLLYASRALVLAHMGKSDEAMSCSDVSVEGPERLWYAHSVRGEVLLKMNAAFRFDALHSFEEAASMAQESWEPWLLAGWALMDAGLFALAAGHLAEAARLNPRAPLCWLCLGDCFHGLRFYEAALFYYQRVVELEPSNELAVQRQRRSGSLVYGLLSSFRRESMQHRWKKEFEKALGKEMKPQ